MLKRSILRKKRATSINSRHLEIVSFYEQNDLFCMYVFGQKVEIPEMKRTSHIFPFLPVKTGNKSEINVTFFRNRNFRISHLTLERVLIFFLYLLKKNHF